MNGLFVVFLFLVGFIIFLVVTYFLWYCWMHSRLSKGKIKWAELDDETQALL